MGHGWFDIDVGCSFQHQAWAVGSRGTSQLLVNEQIMRHSVVLSNLLISYNQSRQAIPFIAGWVILMLPVALDLGKTSDAAKWIFYAGR